MASRAFATLLASALLATPAVAADELRVFAAASLAGAMDAALDACERATGLRARGIYAGTGTVARQVAGGAPADVLVAASPDWMDWLEQRGAMREGTRRDLLTNRLVLVAGPGAEGAFEPGAGRLAVAETESVPAGLYAKAVFEARGWWAVEGFRASLVPAANVREALAWVARGEAGHGVVYATDAGAERRVEVVETFGADEHPPIRYPAAAITARGEPLLDCLAGETAAAAFEAAGFGRP